MRFKQESIITHEDELSFKIIDHLIAYVKSRPRCKLQLVSAGSALKT